MSSVLSFNGCLKKKVVLALYFYIFPLLSLRKHLANVDNV